MLPHVGGARRLGAYGLHLPDLGDADGLLGEAPLEWPEWRVQVKVRSPESLAAEAEPLDTLTGNWARLNLFRGGWMHVDREASRTTLHLDHRPHPGHLLHPYFSLSAGVTAFWRRGIAFHAAGLVGNGAWGVLGRQGSGKSSTVAAWADAGFGVLTDDVLVVSEERALAGPRCIDLRTDLGEQHPAAEPQGRVGARDRWRVTAAPVEPAMPMRGFFTLAWADEIELRPIPLEDRLRILFSSLTLRVPPLAPAAFQRVTALPMWELRRPRDFSQMPAVVERLAAATGHLQG